jgi:C-terminal peptidase prc
MRKTGFLLLLVVLTASLVLVACGGGGAVTEAPEPTVPPATPTATETPQPTATPTKKPASNPLATAMALAQQVTVSAPTAQVIDPHDYVGIFEQAWRIVKENYVRDNYNGTDWDAVYQEYLPRAQAVQSDEELDALLTDLIRELHDDHSRYVPKNRFGNEFGVGESSGGSPWGGIEIWPVPREYEYMIAWRTCGPAAQAGIEQGDVILAVDGVPIERTADGFSIEDIRAVYFGRNPSSPTVTYTVQSSADEDPRDVTVTKGGGVCDQWDHFLVSESPRIGYIRVLDFEGNADTLIMDAIRDMEKDAPLDGLIVDVRHNPGGNSDKSMQIFAEGVIGTVGTLRADGTRTIYRIRGPVKWNTTTPMAVLTDGGSHSAAEYFAIGLQVLKRATIIGENTAGNTEGINSFNLANGAVIRLAISSLLLEDGTSLEGVGVTPDIRVPVGKFGLRQRPYDVQLQAAIDYLKKQIP